MNSDRAAVVLAPADVGLDRRCPIMPPMVVAKHVLYGGRVQGVGFRYTAHRLAQGLHVAGTVRNLPSGEVELIAEGPSDQVDQLLRLIAVEMAGNVQDAQVTETVPVGLQGFQILH